MTSEQELRPGAWPPGRPAGHGHGHGHGHNHGPGQDFSAAAELLDLDVQVFRGFLDDVVTLVAQTAAGPVRRIADLGCGSGTGTLALAERFPRASLFPVDSAGPLLEHLRDRALGRGLAERIHPVLADLDDGWPPSLTGLDLAWASASLHHVADPAGTLASLRSALVPGGLLALIEVDDLQRFQPVFLTGAQDGPGGLESRARGTLLPDMLAAMPYLQADWGGLLASAGFTIEADHVFDLAPSPPLPAATARYAVLSLRRLRDQLRDLGREDQLTAADLAALDQLTGHGPQAVQHRDDLAPRSRRRLWLARRP